MGVVKTHEMGGMFPGVADHGLVPWKQHDISQACPICERCIGLRLVEGVKPKTIRVREKVHA